MRSFRITLAGPVPQGLTDEIGRRFGPAEVLDTNDGTALQVAGLDQAGLRSVLVMLWDTGAEVWAVSPVETHPGEPPAGWCHPTPMPKIVSSTGQ